MRVVIVHLAPVRLAPSELLSRVAAWYGTGWGELADVDDRHGNAVERAVSRRFVDDRRRRQRVGVGEPLATDIRVLGLPCPQPCGNDTTPGLIASVMRLDRRAHTLSCLGARS